MVTALYVVIFLCILVLTALGMVWLSSRKKDKPEIKEEKVLDIKEPVYSFVECFKNNPKRFILKERRTLGGGAWTFYYTLIDRETHKSFKLIKYFKSNLFRSDKIVFSGYPNFLTKDEITFIVKQLTPYYNERGEKYCKYLVEKRERSLNKEREQLMKDYCGG